IPMTSAARRASRASSSVQQPRAPDRYVCGLRANARCTPVTSCPASAARAAATAESTPPDMAASTLTGSRVSGLGGRPGRPPTKASTPLRQQAEQREEREAYDLRFVVGRLVRELRVDVHDVVLVRLLGELSRDQDVVED